jgi:hypothetical protein
MFSGIGVNAMTFIVLCLVSWVIFGALVDAIRFAKGGEDCYEVWHILKWFYFWVPTGFAIYKMELYKNIWLMVLLVAGSFMFNYVYRVFRALNVYKLDNKYRIKWLGKVLGRDGII